MTLGAKPEAVGLDRMAALVRRHQGGVWRYLRWLGCGWEEAEELAQEVFVVLLGRGFEERSEGETRSFLRRTARNLWSEHRRRRRRRAEREWADVVTDAFVAAEERRDERLEVLVDCVERLPERSRQVVDWYYREGWRWGEIAGRLGMRPAGVKTLLQRIRVVLRECVDRGTGRPS